MSPRIKNLVGRKYARWEVIRLSHVARSAYWLCKCSCGTMRTHTGDNLQGGKTKSCGCLRKEVSRNRKITHNKSRSVEYVAWAHMIGRCYNPKSTRFESWGGRGIKVCRRWWRFENFIADMGFKPSPDHSLDRINNDGNYEPSNCRWATRSQQNKNKRQLTRGKR